MASEITTLLISFLYLQFLQTPEARMMHIDHLQLRPGPELMRTPELNIFFHYNTLQAGARFQFYFPTREQSSSPRLLPRQQSDSIPFSTSRLRWILEFFSFPESSEQALAVRTTLAHCESRPIQGETKFCAASLESMLDSVAGILGSNSSSGFKLVTTNYVGETKFAPLQNYTVAQNPTEISAQRIVACHLLPYPYAVFYCHSQDGDSRLYSALLDGEDGGRVQAAAICHMDTTEWDPLHVAFRVLGMGPGGSPVCHVFPSDSLV